MEPENRRNNNNCRWSTSTDDISIENPIKCTGKCCRSCSAGIIADCVAICCCPLAVVSFLAFALVKAPVMIGRRCLGLGKNGKRSRRRREERKKNKKMNRICESVDGGSECIGEDMNGISGVWRVEEGSSEIVFDFGVEEEDDNLSGRFEGDRIWLELHQLGHLSFGRLSFTGIPSLGKAN
ncbi:uncharacterized protein LOC124930057 [Impatiens glandulifera]|uniref:uncharacterized protein LOC124930057 n=1 Tax=Impatiens glandulifera TaxID=253017 RepID=UPI001FB11C20|nr:uncharacterized protein LOC124930057 [Impatiens glandulifera]